MKIAITEKKVPYCEEEGCEGLVKPKIVFFGEQLPAAFFAARDLPGEADLCLVMGTSLSVQPFASLPASCAAATPRVLINMDQVGGIGSRPDDVLVLGDCDSGVRKLAEAAGWEEELEQLWKMTSPEKAGWREEEARRERERVEAMTEDERIEEEVEQLTRGVAETLRLERAQTEWLERHIEEKAEKVEKVGGAAAAASAVSETNGVEAGDISKEQEAILRAEDVPPPKSRQPTSADAGGGLQHVFPWLSRPSL
jgi:NAD-dependent histone deacetylase SIR2